MELYKEVRAKTPDEFYGNEELLSSLWNLKNSKNCPDVFMFTGDTGCGKTTLAHLLAKDLGVEAGIDLIVENASNRNGVDDVREIVSTLSLNAPRPRAFIIDEVHRYTPQAWKAFLTPMEAPLRNTYIIFCTTNPEQIGGNDKQLHDAVMNRCSVFQLKRLGIEAMYNMLDKINKDKQLGVDFKVLFEAAKVSEGVPRQAIQLLSKVSSLDKESAMSVLSNSSAVMETTEEQNADIFNLCKGMITKGMPWPQVCKEIKSIRDSGKQPEGLRIMLLKYCSTCLLGSRKDTPLWNTCLLVQQCFCEPYYDINTAWACCIMDCARFYNEIQ